jgi:hypothetical protein
VCLVELRHTGKTVSGQVAVEESPPSDFFGWQELIDRLEHAAARGPGFIVEPREETRGSR